MTKTSIMNLFLAEMVNGYIFHKKSFMGVIHFVHMQNFPKANISYFLMRTHTCVYQGVRNVSFLETFAYKPSEWPQYIKFYIYNTDLAFFLIWEIIQLILYHNKSITIKYQNYYILCNIVCFCNIDNLHSPDWLLTVTIDYCD